MKRTYAFLLSGTMLLSLGLYSCGTENTTGVDTETTENELDGRQNMESGDNPARENVSPLDTANNRGNDTTNRGATTSPVGSSGGN